MEKRKPLTRLVYDNIYSDILSGVLCPNDIISENSLVGLYGVSKSPVREALITLCDENVLQSIPRTGYRVVQIMPNDVVQLIEARKTLEVYMLEKSFPHLTSGQIEQLRICEKDIVRASEHSAYAARWHHNMGFHLLLSSFANNKYMTRMLEDTLRACTRASTQYFANINSEIIVEKRDLHQMIIEACIEKDLEQAKQLIVSDTEQLLFLVRGI